MQHHLGMRVRCSVCEEVKVSRIRRPIVKPPLVQDYCASAKECLEYVGRGLRMLDDLFYMSHLANADQ